MANPRISVLMSVYNAELYVSEAIQSILDQTYTDFEFIIINDGSTDQSMSVIQKFTDSRIILIDQPNSGQAGAFNAWAHLCRGEYIAIMDADDVSLPDRFLQEIDYLDSHPDISVISGSSIYIDENGKSIGRTFSLTNPKAIRKAMYRSGCVISHPAAMMRRNDFEAVGRYTPSLKGRFTDYHLWMKFLIANYEIANLSTVLIKYRLVNNAISSVYSLSPTAKAFLLKTIVQIRPSTEDIDELYRLCTPQKVGKDNRVNQVKNIQNRVFSFLKIFGIEWISRTISELKNIYVLISE